MLKISFLLVYMSSLTYSNDSSLLRQSSTNISSRIYTFQWMELSYQTDFMTRNQLFKCRANIYTASNNPKILHGTINTSIGLTGVTTLTTSTSLTGRLHKSHNTGVMKILLSESLISGAANLVSSPCSLHNETPYTMVLKTKVGKCSYDPSVISEGQEQTQ